MNFITESDPITLEVKDFSAKYSVPYFKMHSLKEHFIKFFNSPLKYIFEKEESITILDNISFSLKNGDRLGILGNNGSGKTTLVRHISGIYGPSSKILKHGKIRAIFDTDVVILPELSGKENLKIAAHFLFNDLSSEEIDKIILESETFCELGKYLDVPFKFYSKGMKTRLLLSLISARPADVLILDEVYNGADHFFSEKITTKIKETIFKSSSVIIISHSQNLISEICNRVIVLNQKKIVFDGIPEDGILFYKNNCNSILLE